MTMYSFFPLRARAVTKENLLRYIGDEKCNRLRFPEQRAELSLETDDLFQETGLHIFVDP
jgi:hypothetical protein